MKISMKGFFHKLLINMIELKQNTFTKYTIDTVVRIGNPIWLPAKPLYIFQYYIVSHRDH
jgi:hypothetical protein